MPPAACAHVRACCVRLPGRCPPTAPAALTTLRAGHRVPADADLGQDPLHRLLQPAQRLVVAAAARTQLRRLGALLPPQVHDEPAPTATRAGCVRGWRRQCGRHRARRPASNPPDPSVLGLRAGHSRPQILRPSLTQSGKSKLLLLVSIRSVEEAGEEDLLVAPLDPE